MKYAGKKSLSSYLKVFIILLMITAVVTIITLPKLFRIYVQWLGYAEPPAYLNSLLGIVYISGIMSFFILNNLRKIFNTLENLDPFVYSNVKSLRRISYLCFLIGIIYIAKIFILNSFMTIIIIFIFIICGFFALILSDVFNQAVIYKEENDLTI